jgi:hypothetical protein
MEQAGNGTGNLINRYIGLSTPILIDDHQVQT